MSVFKFLLVDLIGLIGCCQKVLQWSGTKATIFVTSKIKSSLTSFSRVNAVQSHMFATQTLLHM